MELQKLRGFYWASHCLSFSEAAAKIHVSQSAISHQVKSLEDELGVKLYERSGRGIVLTPEGERLEHYARVILHSVDDLMGEFAELSGRPHGSIRIAAFRGIATYQLPAIVQRFRERHPEVRLVISSETYDTEILKMVASGEADVGLTASWNEFGDLRYFEVLSYGMYACTPQDHAWVGRADQLSLNEIAEQPLVLYERGTAIRDHIDEVFTRHGLHPDVAIEVGGSSALREYVRIGLGVSIISGLVVGGSRDEQGIHAIPVTDIFGRLGYGVVLRRGRYVSSAIQEFMRSAGIPEDQVPSVA